VADCITYAISTDAIYGYTALISSSASGNLALADDSAYVTPTHGTMETPAVFAAQTTGGAWGFGIPSGQIKNMEDINFDTAYQTLPIANTANTAHYAAIPTTPTAFAKTDAPNSTDDIYNIYFAIAAGTSMPTGEYSGTVVVSGTLNDAPGGAVAPGTAIQTVTAANCPATRTRVVDARDNATYWVRKIGSLCWMETNLTYAGGGDNTYGDVMPAIAQGGNQAYNTAYYSVSPGSNRTTGTTDPSTSTDGGKTNPQYGYFYNWCAAMGRQAAACQNSAATQPDQSVNPGDGTIYNVCPAGWRLPTGNTGGEFTALNDAINGGSSTSPSGLLTNGLVMLNGFANNGAPNDQGNYGTFWSSTVADKLNVWFFDFSPTSSRPVVPNYKYFGFGVRCVAP
jgi:uncharacterized protein (TIGR02145 family)